MSKLETKIISVLPGEEQKTIELYEKFGWEVKNSQEIFNEETTDEYRTNSVGDVELWNVTTTTNYVKITFQRDKEMKKYDEVNKLQKEYEANLLIIKKAPSIFPGKILLIIMGIFILSGVVAIGSGEFFGIVMILISVGIFALRYFLYYKPKDVKAATAYGKNKDIDKRMVELNEKNK